MGAQHRKARITFKKEHGDEPPYTCEYEPCGKEMTTLEVVHHKDENMYNNDVSNLAAMHKGCHNLHHGIGQKHSPEVLKKLRDLHLGAKRAPEVGERISKALKGKPGHAQTEETKRKISEGQKKRWERVRNSRGG